MCVQSQPPRNNLWPFCDTILMEWAVASSSGLNPVVRNGTGKNKQMVSEWYVLLLVWPAAAGERVLCIYSAPLWVVVLDDMEIKGQMEEGGLRRKVIFLVFPPQTSGGEGRKIKNIVIWFAGRFVWLSWILQFATSNNSGGWRKLAKEKMIRNWNNLSWDYYATATQNEDVTGLTM